MHDLASRVERLDQTPDGDHGALDGGGRLLGDVAERALPLHVVRDAVEVALVKVVLGIHHLEWQRNGDEKIVVSFKGPGFDSHYMACTFEDHGSLLSLLSYRR